MHRQLLKNVLLDPTIWLVLLANIGIIYWFTNQNWTNEFLFLYFLLHTEVLILIMSIRSSLNEKTPFTRIFAPAFLFLVCNGFLAVYVLMFFNGTGSLTFGAHGFNAFETFLKNLINISLSDFFVVSLSLYFFSQLANVIRDTILNPKNKPGVSGTFLQLWIRLFFVTTTAVFSIPLYDAIIVVLVMQFVLDIFDLIISHGRTKRGKANADSGNNTST